MSEPLRVLMVEDNEDDAELICLELRRSGYDVEYQRVESEGAFVAALEEPWDLILSDFQMPTFDGLSAFTLYWERGLSVPFIFVSGTLGEERAVEAMRAGARDYVLKSNLGRLGVTVKRELAEAKSQAARRRAERAQRAEQRRLAMAVEASGAGVFELRIPPDEDTYISERWLEILGFPPGSLPAPETFVEWLQQRVHSEDADMVKKACGDFIAGRMVRQVVEMRVQHFDGQWVDVSLYGKALERDEQGMATHIVGVMMDLTERRELENQLRQAQKMEAVGRLAGGVAHDFNNLLTAIFSFAQFAQEDLDESQPAYEDIQEVLSAARKAESLTAQLLAFSRRKPISPLSLNINDLVSEMDRMLTRVVGEDVTITSKLSPQPWSVRADPGSLEQVILNLAVNARDAMPAGGDLVIATENVTLDEEFGRTRGVRISPGQYVSLTMTDSGTGIEEAVLQQIFEPFFTTKEAGKGTGLGLSTCYGIVKQAGGFIWADSELGEGTTFEVYLPRVAGEAEEREDVVAPQNLEGTETILIAEDDPQVRRLAVRVLSRLGYRVVDVASGSEAIEVAQNLNRPVDLLLTDVVMPKMSGRQLVKHLRAACDVGAVLYMSGYTANAIADRGVIEPEVRLLQKPFTPELLASKVRAALDA